MGRPALVALLLLSPANCFFLIFGPAKSFLPVCHQTQSSRPPEKTNPTSGSSEAFGIFAGLELKKLRWAFFARAVAYEEFFFFFFLFFFFRTCQMPSACAGVVAQSKVAGIFSPLAPKSSSHDFKKKYIGARRINHTLRCRSARVSRTIRNFPFDDTAQCASMFAPSKKFQFGWCDRDHLLSLRAFARNARRSTRMRAIFPSTDGSGFTLLVAGPFSSAPVFADVNI